jgi:naphthoate synthase
LTTAKEPSLVEASPESMGINETERHLSISANALELAGKATLLYYLSDEAKEGKNAFLEKRQPDFSKYPKFP